MLSSPSNDLVLAVRLAPLLRGDLDLISIARSAGILVSSINPSPVAS